MKAILGIMALASLVGCAEMPVSVPKQIGNKGLLVAEVCGANITADFSSGDINVNNQNWLWGMTDGHVVGAFAAKKTEFWFVEAGYQNILSVRQEFELKEGRATNVGLVVFAKVGLTDATATGSGGDSPGIRKFYLNNEKETRAFLKKMHPALYDSLQGDKIVALGTARNDATSINTARMAVARSMIDARNYVSVPNPTGYVAGCAGTLAYLKRESPDAGVLIQLLDTNTFDDLNACSASKDRVACALRSGEVLLGNGKNLVKQALPDGIVSTNVYVFGDKSLVAVDNAMTIFTSLDAGKVWTTYDGAKLAAPPPLKASDVKLANPHFGFLAGQNGYYVYSKDMSTADSKIIYWDQKLKTFSSLALPADIKNVTVLAETEDGLALGTSWNAMVAKSRLYFQNRATGQWEERKLPQSYCRNIISTGTSKKELQLLCANEVWKSSDQGKSWGLIPMQKSAF
jgi:hypothetical protein